MTDKTTADRMKQVPSLIPTILSAVLAVVIAFGGSYVNTSVQVTELRVKVEMLEKREIETRDSLKSIVRELKQVIEKNHDDLSGEIKALRAHLMSRQNK